MQFDIDTTNRKKLRDQPVIAIKQREIVQVIFSYYTYIKAVTLNIEKQIPSILTGIRCNMTNRNALLIVLY